MIIHSEIMWFFFFLNRFTQKPPIPWLAIMPPGFALVITLLLGYIFNEAINRIATVEEDYQKMMELKARAEAADVAKSQVTTFLFFFFYLYLIKVLMF